MTTIDSVIAAVRPHLRRFSRRLPERYRDDATQEACVEIWRNASPILAASSPEGYATVIGRRSIARFSPERPATGAPARSLGSGRVFQRSTGTISSDWLREEGVELSTPAPDLDTAIDIENALLTLSTTDFVIVYDRFFEGLTWHEVGESVGLSSSGAFNRWERTIRPALASALAS